MAKLEVKESYGDEVAEQNIQNTSSNLEVEAIKLAGHSSLFSLHNASLPDQRAQIHALNHLVSTNESLTLTTFKHALILMSLENATFRTASTPPEHSYTNPSISSLLLDHPFNLNIISKETSIVPISSDSNVNAEILPKSNSYSLQINMPQRNLEDHSILEVYKTKELLQELISLQATYPYLDVFEHKHSESVILVVHAGFDGSPMHIHKSSSHMHTRVGFQNYLKYVAEKFGHIVDKAVEEDEKRKEEFDEERASIVAQKLLEMQKQQETLSPLEESLSAKDTKTKKNSRKSHSKPNSSMKKMTENTLKTPDPQAIEASLPSFEKPWRFTAYDMGDIVLCKENTLTTLFTADGVKVQSVKHLAINGPSPSEVSLLHKGHRVTCIQVIQESEKTNNLRPVIKTTPSIPQPPSHLKYASLQACFKNSLRVTCSHYGPKGDGNLPHLPNLPTILEANQTEVSSSRPPSRPPSSQFGISPKLNKKQQQEQNLLLEQQRIIEAQQEKERQAARLKYDKECNCLIQNNMYQQLFISTEFGLEVNCKPMVNLDTNSDIMDGSNACMVVTQKYSFPDKIKHLNESISRERYRLYHPEGFVIKYMTDQSVVILSANGNKYRTASSKELDLFNQQKHEKQDNGDTDSTVDQGKNDALSSSINKEQDSSDMITHSKKKSSINMELDVDTSLPSSHNKKKVPVASGDPDNTEVHRLGKGIASTGRVTFAGNIGQCESLPLKHQVWVVTTFAGKSYFFQQEKYSESKEEEVTEEVTVIDPVLHEDNSLKSKIACEDKIKNWVIPMDSVYVLEATDPITKEVSRLVLGYWK